jgi:hypothetical protein
MSTAAKAAIVKPVRKKFDDESLRSSDFAHADL